LNLKILEKKLFIGCKKASTLKIPLSLVARIISNIPNGNNTNVANHPPRKGDIVFDYTIFLHKKEMKK